MKQSKQSKLGWWPWALGIGILAMTLILALLRPPSAQTVSDVVLAGRNAKAEPDVAPTMASTSPAQASTQTPHQ